MERECKTAAEAQSAIDAGDTPVLCGDFTLEVRANIKIVVRAGAPRVEAWESSAPRVEAKGCVQLRVRGSVAVTAAAAVAILVLGGKPKIEGGGYVHTVDCSTPAKWCEHYGVEVRAGVALLGKVVRDDYRSSHAFTYAVGATPVAPDWNGAKQECGGGLHFSPVPAMAREFDRDGTRYLVCPVALADIVVHPNGDYPQKCKARAVDAPLWEVTVDGAPVDARSRELRDAFYARDAKPVAASRKTRVATKKRATTKRKRARALARPIATTA
jgi:hypothetical protein